jgi:hypothetical protein
MDSTIGSGGWWSYVRHRQAVSYQLSVKPDFSSVPRSETLKFGAILGTLSVDTLAAVLLKADG